jgi:hypothetical protein
LNLWTSSLLLPDDKYDASIQVGLCVEQDREVPAGMPKGVSVSGETRTVHRL